MPEAGVWELGTGAGKGAGGGVAAQWCQRRQGSLCCFLSAVMERLWIGSLGSFSHTLVRGGGWGVVGLREKRRGERRRGGEV